MPHEVHNQVAVLQHLQHGTLPGFACLRVADMRREVQSLKGQVDVADLALGHGQSTRDLASRRDQLFEPLGRGPRAGNVGVALGLADDGPIAFQLRNVDGLQLDEGRAQGLGEGRAQVDVLGGGQLGASGVHIEVADDGADRDEGLHGGTPVGGGFN